MAYLKKDDETQSTMAPESGGSVQLSSGESGILGGQGGNQNARTQKNSSGDFTNLQKYTDNNREQAETMANRIFGNIGEKRQDIQSNINDISGQYNQDYYTPLAERTQNETENQSFLADVSKNPQNYVNEDNKNRITNIYNTQAQNTPGILDVFGSDVSNAYNQANEFQNRINRSDTEQGRNEYLQDISKPGTTRGNQLLDQLLLQNTPVAKSGFENLRDQESRVNYAQPINEQMNNTQQKIGEYNTVYDANRNALQDMYNQMSERGAALPGYVDQFESYVPSYNQAVKNLNDFYQARDLYQNADPVAMNNQMPGSYDLLRNAYNDLLRKTENYRGENPNVNDYNLPDFQTFAYNQYLKDNKIQSPENPQYNNYITGQYGEGDIMSNTMESDLNDPNAVPFFSSDVLNQTGDEYINQNDYNNYLALQELLSGVNY